LEACSSHRAQAIGADVRAETKSPAPLVWRWAFFIAIRACWIRARGQKRQKKDVQKFENFNVAFDLRTKKDQNN
jgi:hypothetical protein